MVISSSLETSYLLDPGPDLPHIVLLEFGLQFPPVGGVAHPELVLQEALIS